MKNELGKARERQNFIHSLQFEKEFKAYEQLWNALVTLKWATMNLRPVMDVYDANEDPDLRKQKRLNEFSRAFNEMFKNSAEHEPFIDSAAFGNSTT